jgi:DNA-binding transcriptional LysR family regulator
MQWSDRIGRRLKPRDLHVFMAVAQHGNMAKAADSLAISRPVVSTTISELEHTLGVPTVRPKPARRRADTIRSRAAEEQRGDL